MLALLLGVKNIQNSKKDMVPAEVNLQYVNRDD